MVYSKLGRDIKTNSSIPLVSGPGCTPLLLERWCVASDVLGVVLLDVQQRLLQGQVPREVVPAGTSRSAGRSCSEEG